MKHISLKSYEPLLYGARRARRPRGLVTGTEMMILEASDSPQRTQRGAEEKPECRLLLDYDSPKLVKKHQP